MMHIISAQRTLKYLPDYFQSLERKILIYKGSHRASQITTNSVYMYNLLLQVTADKA